jgi:hypothetical protein
MNVVRKLQAPQEPVTKSATANKLMSAFRRSKEPTGPGPAVGGASEPNVTPPEKTNVARPVSLPPPAKPATPQQIPVRTYESKETERLLREVASLTSARDAAVASATSSKALLAKSECSSDDAQRRILALEADIATAKRAEAGTSSPEDSSTECQSLRDSLADANAKLLSQQASFNRELSGAHAEIKQGRESAAVVVQEHLRAFKETQAGNDQTVASLRRELMQAAEDAAVAKDVWNAKLKQVEENLSSATSALGSETAAKVASNKQLEQQVADQQTKLATVESFLVAARTEVGAMTMELSSARAKVNAMEVELTSYKTSAVEFEASMAAMESNMQGSQTQAAQLSNELEALKRHVVQRNDSHKKELDDAIDEARLATKRANEAKSSAEMASGESHRAREDEVSALKQQLELASKKLAEQEVSHDKHARDLKSALTEKEAAERTAKEAARVKLAAETAALVEAHSSALIANQHAHEEELRLERASGAAAAEELAAAARTQATRHEAEKSAAQGSLNALEQSKSELVSALAAAREAEQKSRELLVDVQNGAQEAVTASELTLQKNVIDLQADLVNVKLLLGVAEGDLSSAQERVASVESELASCQSLVLQAESSTAETKYDLQESQAQVAHLKSEIAARTDAHEKELGISRNQALESTKEKNKTKALAESSSGEAQKVLKSAGDEISALRTELATATKEVQETHESLSASEASAIAAAAGHAGELLRLQTAHEKRCTAYALELKDARASSIADLTGSHGTAQALLSASQAVSDAEKQDATARVTALELEVERLQVSLANTESHHARASTKADEQKGPNPFNGLSREPPFDGSEGGDEDDDDDDEEEEGTGFSALLNDVDSLLSLSPTLQKEDPIQFESAQNEKSSLAVEFSVTLADQSLEGFNSDTFLAATATALSVEASQVCVISLLAGSVVCETRVSSLLDKAAAEGVCSRAAESLPAALVASGLGACNVSAPKVVVNDCSDSSTSHLPDAVPLLVGEELKDAEQSRNGTTDMPFSGSLNDRYKEIEALVELQMSGNSLGEEVNHEDVPPELVVEENKRLQQELTSAKNEVHAYKSALEHALSVAVSSGGGLERNQRSEGRGGGGDIRTPSQARLLSVRTLAAASKAKDAAKALKNVATTKAARAVKAATSTTSTQQQQQQQRQQQQQQHQQQQPSSSTTQETGGRPRAMSGGAGRYQWGSDERGMSQDPAIPNGTSPESL